MAADQSRPNALVDDTAGVGAGITFGLLSALRRRRFFHPVGAAFEATLDLDGTSRYDVGLLDERGRRPCVIRLSRGIGLPDRIPDIDGLAIRVLNAHGPGEHQDFLLASSGPGPFGRHALVPAASYAAEYSSVLPYRAGSRILVFGARPELAAGTPAPRTLADAASAMADAKLGFVFRAAPIGGAWGDVGELQVGRRLTDEEAESLRFNPFNTGGGLEPLGVLNGIRRRAYRGSQRGRPVPLPDYDAAEKSRRVASIA